MADFAGGEFLLEARGICRHPIGIGHSQVAIDHRVGDGGMSGGDFLIGQNDDAEFQFRDQRSARNVARERTRVAHQFLAAIVA